jgi:DNA polymerase IV (DinB-like DNA polymerase)
MLVDLDYFFAQCEELRNPGLKDKPIVVAMYSGRTETSGAVSTSNYIARKYKVKSGIPLFLAKKRLEGTDAVFLRVDYDYYQQISDNIMSILENYADVFEKVGIDEAYLDVTKSTEGDHGQALILARKMKTSVDNEVGITFSIGIGPNKLIAKIAADKQKPNGITTVRREDVQEFLKDLPVDNIPGVGKKTATRMSALGIKTAGGLAKYDVQRLIEEFGRTLGIYFHNAAQGIDNEPVTEAGEAESISRISTLKEDTREISPILQKLDTQIDEIYNELSQKKVAFRQVGIIAISTDLTSKSRVQTLERPTKDKEMIRKVSKLLFEEYIQETKLSIRRVGVKVGGFVKEEVQQQQLSRFFQGTS